MEKITRLILLLLMVVIGMYLFLPKKPYIAKSNIHGQGLFSGKKYKKHDVIFENIFPYKDNSIMLFNPITKEKFQSYILNEGRYINHCSLNKNTDIISDDYKLFKVIAIRDIDKHEELFIDYNILHKHFPFIAPALPNYISC
tara:strand:+ start:1444 stop:1869 length:426 start_codon:yes stop_codon:yes gene_type:complete